MAGPEAGGAFVGAQGADLARIFALRHEGRGVANANPVRGNDLILHLKESRFRDHFTPCRVNVFEPLAGHFTCYENRTSGWAIDK
ncbi:MAG: hypothetical protein ACUVXF_01945 [Desulfobaccales bacterium]